MSADSPIPGAEAAGQDASFPLAPVTPGATNPPDPGPSTPESGQDGSGDLGAPHPLDRARALAELIDPQAFQGEWSSEDTRREYQDRALHFAIKVIDAGWGPRATSPSPDERAALVDMIVSDRYDHWSIPTSTHAEAIAEAILGRGYRRVSESDTVAGMVRQFHEAFGVAINQHATGDLRHLRADLLGEECGEARYAILADDLAAIAKELADVVIVAYGSALTFGIDLDAAVALVHESNMSKLGDDGKPVLRPDGKVLKGSNYRAPDMSSSVREGTA